MQSIRFILPMLLMGTLTACSLNDSHDDFPSLVAFSTTHLSPELTAGYHFSLDNKQTIHAGDVSRVGAYMPRDSARTIIYFKLLDQPAEGFDYNAELYDICEIPVKPIDRVANDQELESYGLDRIHIENTSISGGYLNVFYALPANEEHSKHRLSVVENNAATPPTSMPEGYTLLEMRHDAKGDSSGHISYNYICFKLDTQLFTTSNTKGIYLKYKSLSGAPAYVKVEFVYTKQ